MKKEEIEIGRVTINYKKDGNVLDASFKPVEEFSPIAEVLKKFKLSKPLSQDSLQHNAEMVLASWFERQNKFELSDREKFKIDSKIVYCEQFDTGVIKTCVIDFVFTEI